MGGGIHTSYLSLSRLPRLVLFQGHRALLQRDLQLPGEEPADALFLLLSGRSGFRGLQKAQLKLPEVTEKGGSEAPLCNS